MEQADFDIITTLVVGTLGMLLLATALILFVFVYQKRLLKQKLELRDIEARAQREMLDGTIQTQEVERRRIARDLHDDIGAMLSTAKMGVNQIIRHSKEIPAVQDLASETKSMMDDIITNVRRISHNLLPATLEEFGLADTLEGMMNKVRTSGSHLEVISGYEGNIPRLDTKVELSLYRIAQELINNSLKHAQANYMSLTLTRMEGCLRMEFKDDGVGFDVDALKKSGSGKKGLGLTNIESRVSLMEATVAYRSTPGNGVRVTIDLDLP